MWPLVYCWFISDNHQQVKSGGLSINNAPMKTEIKVVFITVEKPSSRTPKVHKGKRQKSVIYPSTKKKIFNNLTVYDSSIDLIPSSFFSLIDRFDSTNFLNFLHPCPNFDQKPITITCAHMTFRSWLKVIQTKEINKFLLLFQL